MRDFIIIAVFFGLGTCAFRGKKRRKVLEHQHWSKGVGAESEEGRGGVDLGWGFLGVKDSRNDEGELEGVFGRWEDFLAL